MPQASNFHQAQRAMSTTSNATTQSRATTGTGQNSNSAHYSKKYPCPHKGCPQRFNEKKSLNVHKDSEHDYCMPCDLDFEDDEALHIHKMSSARHIVCPICGIDFKSEPGRDRHTKQVSSPQSVVICPPQAVVAYRQVAGRQATASPHGGFLVCRPLLRPRLARWPEGNGFIVSAEQQLLTSNRCIVCSRTSSAADATKSSPKAPP